MKKIIFAVFLILTSFQILSAQKKSDFDLITSGKWHLEYVEMAGQKMKLPVEMQKNSWVIFHSDGKQEGMEEGRKYIGKWKFDKLKKIIRTDDLDGKVDQKLISVTENKLVVSVKEQGADMIMGMTK
ncbi:MULTISPECIES: hypothetical protein [unclassified Cellulophaga]|uniref:hypothetical protein n=1 Tax=unclassified Cellulophaga TaxID=2634405 RepID=UPI0026E3F6A2|nr:MULTISPECIES: hypothetical protein [unclassified Cellulophaga]MDO6492441.1 hypothetical protein [Cellulophaga sp. 2_MG-2023]MDO6496059.1 hypothetical protein [Cellulophaga sp. 3_MG-2023]